MKRSHHRLPDDQPRKVVPYSTEEERLEARRKSSLASKERKAQEKADRTANIEIFLRRMEGTGCPERRQRLLEIAERMKNERAAS